MRVSEHAASSGIREQSNRAYEEEGSAHAVSRHHLVSNAPAARKASWVMRFRELNEARPWKSYEGRTQPCIIASPEDLGNGKCIITQADVHYGAVYTGRAEVFCGYFVRIEAIGEEWLGEDKRSLRQALLQAAAVAHHSGWSIIALGCTPEFRETGLSANSGYGTHPAHPDRHVHMLEPIPRQREIE